MTIGFTLSVCFEVEMTSFFSIATDIKRPTVIERCDAKIII